MFKFASRRADAGFWRVLLGGALLAAGMQFPLAALAGAPMVIEEARLPSGSGSVIPSRHRITVSAPDLAAMQAGESFSLNIPGHSAAFEIVFDRIDTSFAPGSSSWIGHLQGHGDLYRTIITTSGDHSAGRISTPEGNFHIETVNGVSTLVDLDRAGLNVPAFGEDGHRPLPHKAASGPAAVSAASAAAAPVASAASSSGNSVIDVLVLYNPSFVTATGNAYNTIASLIAVANQAMSDSGVAVTFRLVGTSLLAMSDADDNDTILYKVTYPSDPTNRQLINDPIYSGVPALRAQYGADLVVSIRQFGPTHVSCGVAWTLTELNTDQGISQDAPYGYAVVSYGSYSTGRNGGFVCDNVTMAHEMGHNMGSEHDRAHSLNSDGTLSYGAYPYSFGYGMTGVFATIMAANYIQAPIVAKYSSPNLTCTTVPLNPCGVVETDPVNGANNVLSLNNTRARVAQFSPTVVPNQIVPATGYWWNPAEGGRGYNIEQRGNNLFMATFLYDATGSTTWFGVGPGPMVGNTFTGTLETYSGGQTLSGAYKPATQGPSGGNFSITFTSPTTATITWPGGTVPISRYDFGPGGSAATQPANTPQAGWWWAPTEGGRGFAVEIQGGSMFLAGYMYDTSGKPVWYASGPTPMSGTTLYTGVWQQYQGGQTLTGSYKSPTVAFSNVGPVTIQFTSTTTGSMTFPDGHTVPIQRFTF